MQREDSAPQDASQEQWLRRLGRREPSDCCRLGNVKLAVRQPTDTLQFGCPAFHKHRLRRSLNVTSEAVQMFLKQAHRHSQFWGHGAPWLKELTLMHVYNIHGLHPRSSASPVVCRSDMTCFACLIVPARISHTEKICRTHLLLRS